MLPPSLQLDLQHRDGISLILLQGPLIARTIPTLAKVIVDEEDRFPDLKGLHLDFSSVEYIDSRGIGALIGWHTHFTGRGIDFRILNPVLRVRETLRIAHIDTLLELGPSIEDDHTRLARKVSALWQSYEYVEKILAAIGEGLVGLNPLGRILFVNPAAQSFLQVKEEVLLGLPLDEALFSSAGCESVTGISDEDIIAVARGRCPLWKGELTINRSDKPATHLSIIASSIVLGGRYEGAVIGLSDITTQYASREAMLESEARYRHLYDLSPVMMCSVNANGSICDVNRMWLEKTGYSREEVLGQQADFLCTIDPRLRDSSISIQYWKDGPVRDVPLRFLRKDGTEMEVLLSADPTTNPHGDRIVLSVVQDVTDQRVVEKVLRHRDAIYQSVNFAAQSFLKSSDWELSIQEVLRRLGEAAGVSRTYLFQNRFTTDGDLVTDQRYEWVAPGIPPEIDNMEMQGLSLRLKGTGLFESLLGKREVVYGHVRDFAPPERRLLSSQGIESIVLVPLFVNESWWGFLGFDECTGEREWSTIEIDALRTAASTLSAAIQRRANEQERLNLEAQVQQTQKLESLGILAGGIAHDFNNLLLGILGNADLALMELKPESPARQHIEDAVKASQRAAELCSQMLAYSGRGNFILKPLDLSVLVEEMAHLLEVSISKKVSLRLNFARKLPPVEADPTQLRQVVMNLIINASDAIGDQIGQISVSTGVANMDRISLGRLLVGADLPIGRYAFLEVTDTGCGMDRSTLERIFDPFFTTKFTGRGLGLAAVHGIVRSHHGAIDIHSEPGHGTSFRILFPVSNLPITELPSPSFKRTERKGSGTVLVVDDEEIITDITTKILSQAGFRVFTASDGRRGVETFCQHASEIDAVVLDLTMPEMSGEEVYNEMVLVKADVRVILSSGYSESEAAIRFAGKNLAGFIQKPYRPNVLIEKLNEVLGK